ncbi:EAL domain-containing protein [Pseudomonas sp. WS 5532]|jgi:EAL domain-containing protein (putative c-di-GMP-specific phosphodiesterase class I)|uniref:EAL domain-containing protein n=1 Tax=Pseudomonas edaphica TaxID=2006980 RepID=A0A7Y8FP84_9PSED|nr:MULTISPECIES: EAL domain-containing protein [Pseudomonas]MCF5230687.1 EAL domain-containing protein [Pseudomonas sp. PA-5-4H]MCF5238315.1 EAL domain-containing protein [Pseudomonas sp. PA-5-4G]MCF5250057.1 EAL domain-containing protein [Pseudomonas sp. PA-5-4B]MCF5256195.1 EAL domain-containing protein [Pseudomonas sp. PA-5-4B]MCF5260066.1 EAL domain-containing protein [Pseudomonas sp. PA-5-4A]
MIQNAVVPNEFSALRVVTLASDAACAHRLAFALSSMGVTPIANIGTLSAVEAWLRESPIDVIVCEIRPECGDGLMLPSLLRGLHEAGTLARLPCIFWTGETALDAPAGEVDVTRKTPASPLWIKYMGGVAVSALESHARLARTAGISVQILREGATLALGDALRAVVLTRAQPDARLNMNTFDDLAEDEVINALTTGEGLRFVFQPQFELLSRRIVGAEALVRWKHPRFGEIPPSVLMPLVNRLGLDLLLFSLVEMWTIKAMLALKREHIGIPIAVNASAKTICTPDFSERLAARMRQAGLPNRLLKIELTEDVPEPDELYLSASLTAIRAKGFQVSMDDFGTGAATLNLLANLSFDEMKIDGSFVRGVEQHSSSRKVIAGIVNWARLLSLNLVAEGIEDESTIALLYRLGCRVGQGYALARPMEMDDFLNFVIQRENSAGAERF